MKRVCLGILLTVFGGCTVGTPVADDKKSGDTAESQNELAFANGIPGFCNDACARFTQCPDVDVAADCLAECVDYMSVFLSHGDDCVALGVGVESCVNGIQTCDEYANPPACEQDNGPHDLCAARGSQSPSGGGSAPPTCAGCDPTCDVVGGGSGPANPGGAPVTASCQLDADGCSDGSVYQLRCETIDGVLTCSCFKNGEGTGSFESHTGCPPSTGEMYQGCGWALPSF